MRRMRVRQRVLPKVPSDHRGNKKIHPCVRELSQELDDLLKRVSFDSWEPRDKERREAELREAISSTTSEQARAQQLFELVLETVYMRANIAIDYMRALPSLLVSSSLLAVRPMTRVALEAIALLDWHCEPDLSAEERVLRAFGDSNKSWAKAAGKALGIEELSNVSEMTIGAIQYTKHKTALQQSATLEETKTIGEAVLKHHGAEKYKRSNHMKDPSAAVEDVVACMHTRTESPGGYEMLSDAVHVDAYFMAAGLRLCSTNGEVTQSRRAMTIENLVMPVGSAIAVMYYTFLRMETYWKLEFSPSGTNRFCELLVRRTGECGSAPAIWH